MTPTSLIVFVTPVSMSRIVKLPSIPTIAILRLSGEIAAGAIQFARPRWMLCRAFQVPDSYRFHRHYQTPAIFRPVRNVQSSRVLYARISLVALAFEPHRPGPPNHQPRQRILTSIRRHRQLPFCAMKTPSYVWSACCFPAPEVYPGTIINCRKRAQLPSTVSCSPTPCVSRRSPVVTFQSVSEH